MIRVGSEQKDAEVRRLKLEKAAKDFESLFVLQLLKTMRASYLSDSEKDSGLGKDMFMSIADEALANRISESGSFGIAKKLIESFNKRETAGLSIDGGDQSISESLPNKRFIRLEELSTVSDIKPLENRKNISDGKGITKAELQEVVQSAAKEHRVPAKLIEAVIQAESSGDTLAVSRKGAKGLMQLTDSTASDMGVENVFDPEENVNGGSKYLSNLMRRFSGDLKLALAAYNAGPGAVERHGGVPPYPETVRYVDKVMSLMENGQSDVK